jgi:hypothetical protein
VAVPLFRGRRPALDTTDHTIETRFCDDCATHYVRVTGFVHEPDGGPTLASYYAVCHGHPEHEVALDLVLGTWGSDDESDHETYSCILRSAGAMAVDPYVTVSFPSEDDVPAWMGRPMSRDEALGSPRIATVWSIIDALAEGVAPITEQVSPRPRLRRLRGG